MDSILGSIKKLLGTTEVYNVFDKDLVMHINSVFFVLTQLGVGPEEGFTIQDETAVWDDFIPCGANLEAVKSYVYLKVRLLFDPPQSSALTEAINRQISEFEWRLNVAVDPS